MRIAIDAMGSDKGPETVVTGSLQAAAKFDDLIPVFVGDESSIRKVCEAYGASEDSYDVVPATQVIPMDESPIEALRSYPDSSLIKAVQLCAEGKAQGLVSAGSTGAQVAASTLILKTLPGVKRAGIATLVPTRKGQCVVLDVGANVSAKALHLQQYGVMGALYAKVELNVETPAVGLLSVGAESSKGNQLTKEAHDRLQDSPINFVGNVEGHDVFDGSCDVVVTDGFMGNVLLKISEGLVDALFDIMKESAHENDIGDSDAFRQTMRRVAQRASWQEVGGAQLLGINGVSVIAHGRSDEYTIQNALRTVHKLVETKLNQHIVSAFEGAVSAPSS